MKAHFTTDQIALAIYSGCITALAYDADFDTLAEARRINNGDGWTIDESAPLGNITRYEGVRVSDEKLVAAHTIALGWL